MAIYVVSIAILRVLNDLFPNLIPSVCAGLSLGEYTAITASGRISFETCLSLVKYRGRYMQDACVAHQGTMAVILGMSAVEVEKMVEELRLPHDLWAANFNSPGQVVISGTKKGIEAGTEAAKSRGAKRVLPLQVHGAFHSGLMREAEQRLTEHINHAPLVDSKIELVMNVTGDFVKDLPQIRKNMILQVTHPVRWEQSIRTMEKSHIDTYLEVGCGKTLSGLNKRNNVLSPTISVDKVEDLKTIEELMENYGTAS